MGFFFFFFPMVKTRVTTYREVVTFNMDPMVKDSKNLRIVMNTQTRATYYCWNSNLCWNQECESVWEFLWVPPHEGFSWWYVIILIWSHLQGHFLRVGPHEGFWIWFLNQVSLMKIIKNNFSSVPLVNMVVATGMRYGRVWLHAFLAHQGHFHWNNPLHHWYL